MSTRTSALAAERGDAARPPRRRVGGGLQRDAGGAEQQRELGAGVARGAARRSATGMPVGARRRPPARRPAQCVLPDAAGPDERDDAAGRCRRAADGDALGERGDESGLSFAPERSGSEVGDGLLDDLVGQRRVEAAGDERVAQRGRPRRASGAASGGARARGGHARRWTGASCGARASGSAATCGGDERA